MPDEAKNGVSSVVRWMQWKAELVWLSPIATLVLSACLAAGLTIALRKSFTSTVFAIFPLTCVTQLIGFALFFDSVSPPRFSWMILFALIASLEAWPHILMGSMLFPFCSIAWLLGRELTNTVTYRTLCLIGIGFGLTLPGCWGVDGRYYPTLCILSANNEVVRTKAANLGLRND